MVDWSRGGEDCLKCFDHGEAGAEDGDQGDG